MKAVSRLAAVALKRANPGWGWGDAARADPAARARPGLRGGPRRRSRRGGGPSYRRERQRRDRVLEEWAPVFAREYGIRPWELKRLTPMMVKRLIDDYHSRARAEADDGA
jgi:hypothetical protein